MAVLRKRDVDQACEIYLRKRGVPKSFWERSTEDARQPVREELLKIIAVAMAQDVCIDEGE